MSAKTYRPYKIDVYGLQDAYLGTLQSYNDNFIGQVENPSVQVSSDGSQSFSCTIPKYYIDPVTNVKTLNPRWGDIQNGVLAENTRVLKVFIMFDNATKVYPFIIDKITDKRDKSHQVFKQITANGLAFAELGKQGYKLELKQELVEQELENNPDLLMTVQYWADKVFPNTKDKNGKITSWQTPWCYEVRMDWSLYSDFERGSTKVYEDSYVSNWNTDGKTLTPAGFTQGREKSRAIDCYNSNKYNITQTIAETFEIFCEYEYKCDAAGRFIDSYTDQDGNVWTGRKVVFYNRAISTENPLHIYYQKNLNTISRNADSSEVYTKLFIKPVESSVMENGYVSIANTLANPTLDDFILNFDYLNSVGSMTEYQMEFARNYEATIRQLNLSLMQTAPILDDYVVQINQQEAELAGLDKQTASAREQLEYYQKLRDNDLTNGVVIKNKSNSASCIFTDMGNGYSKAALRFEGINAGSITGYSDSSYTASKQVFSSANLKVIKNENELSGSGNFVLLDEYGYASAIYTTNGALSVVYLALEYSPKNKYESVCQSFQDTLAQNEVRNDTVSKTLDKLNKEYDNHLAAYNAKLAEKEELNLKLERVLGPALREGYWTPDSYEDRGKSYTADVKGGPTGSINSEVTGFYYDFTPFDNEQLAYYYVGQQKKYYPYLDISTLQTNWRGKDPDNLVIRFQKDYSYTIQSTTALTAGNYYFTYNYKNYYFNLKSTAGAGTVFIVRPSGAAVTLLQGGAAVTLQSYLDNARNLTSMFAGATNTSMNDYCAYNNAGYVFAYMRAGGKNIPILLFNNDNVMAECTDRPRISYSFSGESGITYIGEGKVNTSHLNELVYPRFYIAEDNVYSASELLTLSLGEIVLEKYYDYTILLRNGKTYITPKFTTNNPIWDITSIYKLVYFSSQANESLYLDARQVSKDYSHPKYSYDLSVSIIHNDDGTMPLVELGQLAYISDPVLGVRAASGYVSEITFDLSSPQKDSIKIANYKTKFEDLFHTITVSSEAMKNNKTSYDIAAGNFGPDGSISGDVLQTAINNNNFFFDYSATGVEISPIDGIVLTNKKPYGNGVYGQVVLQGGGIFLSSEIGPDGRRIWNTGITPQGINASLITAGQLNTNLIKIFSGNEMAFQWNSEGLYAYKFDENGQARNDIYIRYAQDGLHYVKEQKDNNGSVTLLKLVSLDWDGLTLRNNDGRKTMYLEAETGNLNLSGTLKSFNYSPGILGSGWMINQDGYAEFNDILVRGTISASVFKYDETTAVGGSIYVAPTLIFDHGQDKYVSWNGDGNVMNFSFSSPFKSGADTAGRTWSIGDIVGVNGVLQFKNDEEVRYEIKNLRAKVVALNSNGQLTLSSLVPIYNITQNVFYNKNGEPTPVSEVAALGLSNFEGIESWHLIFLGTNGKRQGILITAMDQGSPYIDVYDDQSQSTDLSYGAAPRARLGRLDGLKNITTVTDLYPNISGYGLYSDNVYLTGAIYATSGKIGGLTINANSLGNSDFTIDSKGISISSKGTFVVDTTNFKVAKDGAVSITGTINATGGKIGSLTVENVNDAIGANSSGQVYIKDGVVTANSVAAGAITTEKLSANAVTTDKLAANAVTAGKISANAVTTDKLAASAVTAEKISAGSINTSKVTSDFGEKLVISSNQSITLVQSDLNTAKSDITGFKNGTIPVQKLQTSYITIEKNAINIASGGNINIGAGGTFTVNSGNFKIDSSGNVTMTGTVTASSGSIGGWTIGTSSLYAGSGANYVSLATSGEYRIWAGAATASNAPFRVTSDGSVYLGSLYYLDENGANPRKASLTSSLWKYNKAYNRAVKTLSVSNGSTDSTLTIELFDGTEVNFKKASGTVALVPSGGGSTNFSISAIRGYTGSGTGTTLATTYVYGVLSNVPYSSSSSVALKAGSSLSGALEYASVPVGDVYDAGYSAGKNSVTISSWDGWLNGSNTVKLSNGKTDSITMPGSSSYKWEFGTYSSATKTRMVSVYHGTMRVAFYNEDCSAAYDAGYADGWKAAGAVSSASREGNVITVTLPSSETKDVTSEETYKITAGGTITSITNPQQGHFMATGRGYAYVNGVLVATSSSFSDSAKFSQ